MITRPTLVAQSGLSNGSAPETSTEAANDRTALLPAFALQDFSLGVNTALLAVLAERGDDVSGLAVQRRLRAYAAPRVTASTTLRRYA